MRFSAPNEDVAVLSSGFFRQDVNRFVHSSTVTSLRHHAYKCNRKCQTKIHKTSRLSFQLPSKYHTHRMEYLPEQDLNGSYINESERNVHVWCSIVRPCNSRNEVLFRKPTLGLIAGKLCVCIRTYFVPLSYRLLYS